MTTQFVLIGDESFAIDTLAQEDKAREAVHAAGLEFADVWVGEPTDPDAYKTGSKLFGFDAQGK